MTEIQSTPEQSWFHARDEQMTPEGRRGEVPNLGVNPERRQRNPEQRQSDAKATESPPRGAPDVSYPPTPRGGGMCWPALLVSHHRRVRHLLLPRAPRRSTAPLRWTLLTTCRWPCQTTPPEASRPTIPFPPVYPRLRCGSKLPGVNDASTCSAWLCVLAAEWPLLVLPLAARDLRECPI